ncbi:DUF6056 family protein [Kineosporia sp. R_H_3]|uniref:DUF6056 family protein n=1 Tax=Kineosporia sp. R_H_3 TaxID=1961848 RepID=UPI000B4C01B3|nr:DUF6056 family protein [Kineosporia sp. R_H_3]
MTRTDTLDVVAPEVPGTRPGISGRLLGGAFPGERLLLAVLLVAWSVLASRFPVSGDDWAWGSSIGTDRLDTLFDGYNGRWAGNLAVLALTRAGPLTPLVVGGVVVLTVWLLVDLAGRRTPLRYALVTLLLVAMPVEVFRQSVAWLSGFSNYALAGLGMLVYLHAARALWDGRPRPLPRAVRFPFVVLGGFAAALFMEHVTTYLVLASISFLVVHALRGRGLSGEGAAWAVGIVAGAVLMFSNQAYRGVASGADAYQGVATAGDTGASLVDVVLGVVCGWLVGVNVWLDAALVVLVVLVAAAARRRGRGRAVTLTVVLPAVGALVLATTLRQAAAAATLPAPVRNLSGLVAVLLLGSLLLAGVLLVADPARRAVLVVAVLSVAVVAAPLAVVRPIGPRCFYPTYLLMVLVAATLLAETVAEERSAAGVPGRPGGRRAGDVATWGAWAIGAIAAALFTGLLGIYTVVHDAADRRVDLVRVQVRAGASVVTVDPLPFRAYVHSGDPVGSVWETRYKLYYDLPPSVRIVVRPAQAVRQSPPG